MGPKRKGEIKLYLHKSQFHLLKSLKNKGSVICDSFSDDQMKIVHFLYEQKFIDVKHEILSTSFDSESGTIKNTYGKIISISISEQGRAYLANRKHQLFTQWIPYAITTAISILALVKSYESEIASFFIWGKLLLTQITQQ